MKSFDPHIFVWKLFTKLTKPQNLIQILVYKEKLIINCLSLFNSSLNIDLIIFLKIN